MSRVTTIFDRVFATEQGHFPVSEFPQMDQEAWRLLLQGLQSYVEELNQTIGSNRIRCEFIGATDLNAFATRDSISGEYLIGINRGAIQRLYAVFMTIGSCVPMLGEYGKIDEPAVLDFDAILNGDFSEVLSAQRNPRDPGRRAISTFLFSIAIEYLFLHEAAHILKGHIGRAVAMSKANIGLGENHDMGRVSVDPEERQAMEIDADRHAILWSLTGYYSRTSPVLVRDFWNDPPAFYADEFGKLLLISYGVVIHLLPRIGQALEEFDEDYPHNEVRFNVAYDAVIQYVNGNLDLVDPAETDMQTWLDTAMASLHLILNNHCHRSFLPNGMFPTAYSSPNNQFTRPLLARLNELTSLIHDKFRPIWNQYALIDHTIRAPYPNERD